MSTQEQKDIKSQPSKAGFLRLGLSITAGVILLGVVILGGAFWTLSKGPLDISFAEPTIKKYVRDAKAGFDIDMDDISLQWPDFTGPVLIHMDNVRLVGKDDVQILQIDSVDVDLSYRRLLIGQFRPTAIIIDRPILKVIRTEEEVKLSLQNYEIEEQQTEEESNQTLQQKAALFLAELSDADFAKGTLFSNLDTFEMNNAKVKIEDRVLEQTRMFTKMHAELTRSNLGAALSFTAQLMDDNNKSSGLGVDFVYQKRSGLYRFSTTMQDTDPFIFSDFFPQINKLNAQGIVVDGVASLVLDQFLKPISGSIELQSDQGQLSLDEYYDTPLQFKDAKLTANYSKNKEIFDLENLSVVLNNVPFESSFQSKISNDKIDIPLSIAIPNAKAADLGALIPVMEGTEDAREWLAEKLVDGTYNDIVFNLNILADKQSVVGPKGPRPEWKWNTGDMSSGFSFEGMTVKYSDTLMPATEAKGEGTFDGSTLKIINAAGNVKDVIGSNMDMTFTDFLVQGGGVADITLDLKGPLPTFLDYLADDPINLKDEIGLDSKEAKGVLTGKARVQFPTVKELPKEEVSVVVNGQLSDLNIANMVRGLTLSGGPVSLDVEDGTVKVKGDALLADREVNMDWVQHLDSAGKPFSMQVKAKLGADKELRNHFGIELDDFISGTLPIDLVYTSQADDTALIDLKGALEPIVIHIDPFGYNKPSGVAGSLALKGDLKNETLHTIRDVSLETQDFILRDGTLNFRTLNNKDVELSGGKLLSVKIGKTSQKVDFTVSPENMWTVNASGAVFDAEPFLQDDVKEQKDDNPAFDITLKTETMLTKKQQQVKDVDLKIKLNKKSNVDRLEMQATAGQGQVLVQYRPDANGQRNFSMTASDAGAALKAFDVFPDVRGGKLSIYGEPVGGPDSDDIYGTARMENFKVVKAPALAQLINAMSLKGLDGALQGEGLSFSKLEGNFEWLFRPQGSLLTIKDGRTSGSSLGLTFEGKVDRAVQTMDIKGTIIPLSGMNTVLSNIPLVGNILTGGTGLIAATYTMKGKATEPKVSVNPLSVLAPGFLRTILFEGGFSDGVTPSSGPSREAPQSAPETKQQEPQIPTSRELLNAND